MAEATCSLLEDVDIFDLLDLDPRKLRSHSIGHILKVLRAAYRRAALIAHPDKDPTKGSETIQRLNGLKDFLSDFDKHQIDPRRVTGLVKKGCEGRSSRGNPQRAWKRLRPQENALQAGSSPSNPIVLDAPEILAPYTRQEHDEGNAKSKRRQRCRTRYRSDEKAYHPSRSSQWRPAPYADESDIESVWEQDWDSEDAF
jgi:curved DNA-binding protein CbpA